MAPMTERQIKILDVLADHQPQTPAQIAHLIGIHKGPRRNHGPWSGYQSPAQYIIGSLNGLRGRGYIRMAARPDGMTGTAYQITAGGLVARASV